MKQLLFFGRRVEDEAAPLLRQTWPVEAAAAASDVLEDEAAPLLRQTC